MNRTQRLMALAEHLRGRRTGTTAAALAERFGVSARTIHRDLDALRAAHLPIHGERGRGGGLRLDRTYTLPPVNFVAREGAVLVAAGQWLVASRMMPFAATLQAGLDKIRAALPASRQAELERLLRALAFTGVPARRVDPAVRAVVEQAWFADRPFVIEYGSLPDRAPEPRVVYIRSLVMTRSETLLNCDEVSRGGTRQFKLHKIDRAWFAEGTGPG